MAKKKRGRIVVQIILLLLVAGIAYAIGGDRSKDYLLPALVQADSTIVALEASSELDSAFRVSYQAQIDLMTDSVHVLETSVLDAEDNLARCLATPPDTFYTAPDTVHAPPDTIYAPPDTVSLVRTLPGDTVYLPGEITIREVQTGRGWPHWSDFLEVGLTAAACLVIENTGGSETVNIIREDG